MTASPSRATSDSSAVDATFARIEAELGPPDLLVNNAGAVSVEHLRRVKPLLARQQEEAANGAVTTPLDALVRLTDDEWRRMHAIHLDGTFFCTRAAVRSMGPRRRGVIVNMSPICGLEGCTGHPHYSSAKAAILGFTKSVAKELVVQDIRVNAVAPGHVSTGTLGRRDRRAASRDRPVDARRAPRRPGRDRGHRRVPGLRPRGYFVGAVLSPSKELAEFDDVVLAIGRREVAPEVPGLAHASSSSDAIAGAGPRIARGSNVVIADDGFGWWPASARWRSRCARAQGRSRC